MSDARKTIARVFAETIAVHERVGQVDPAPLVAAVDAVVSALRQGGKVLAFGNGGSAADAQHLAGELVGRYLRDRRALAGIALSTDTSILTAVANDFGYERVFARQIEALGRPGDVAIGISTSGRSANILRAFEMARSMGLVTIAFTGGDGGPMGRAADIHVNVPDSSTPRVQEVQRTQIHILCEIVEERMTTEAT